MSSRRHHAVLGFQRCGAPLNRDVAKAASEAQFNELRRQADHREQLHEVRAGHGSRRSPYELCFVGDPDRLLTCTSGCTVMECFPSRRGGSSDGVRSQRHAGTGVPRGGGGGCGLSPTRLPGAGRTSAPAPRSPQGSPFVRGESANAADPAILRRPTWRPNWLISGPIFNHFSG